MRNWRRSILAKPMDSSEEPSRPFEDQARIPVAKTTPSTAAIGWAGKDLWRFNAGDVHVRSWCIVAGTEALDG